MTMAVMLSPGMPNTSAGIHAPASAALFAEVLSTTPSTWPVPNFSGCLLKALGHGIRHPGRDVGACAGQRTDGRAHHRAAQEVAPVLGASRPNAA
jgi:hypothetical protein